MINLTSLTFKYLTLRKTLQLIQQLPTGRKYLQTTYPTRDYYLEYRKNSVNSDMYIYILEMAKETGRRHYLTFHQGGYTNDKHNKNILKMMLVIRKL